MQAPTLKLYKVSSLFKRNFGVFVPALQKAQDPIQNLFIQKLKEFKTKSAGGKLVEPSPELEKEMKSDRERVMRQFGTAPGEDVTKFPIFKYADVKIESPSLEKPKE